MSTGRELLDEFLCRFDPRLRRWDQGESYREATERAVQLCRERARREWDPIRAVAVLGNRQRIRRALGVERMPAGIGAEERRLRQAWVDAFAKDPYCADTDVMDSSWRPPKQQPAVMGWERFFVHGRMRHKAVARELGE